MKRALSIGIVLTLMAVAYWAGTRSPRSGSTTQGSLVSRKVLYYVDPMNPAHTSDKPGLAPCGMKMEPVYADVPGGSHSGTASDTAPPGSIVLSASRQQVMGLKLGKVEKRVLDHTVRVLGRVAIDETRVYRINATVDGWVTKTLPFASGRLVKKDETLAAFYSPEFLSAGQALLFALSAKDRVAPTSAETPAQQGQIAQFNLNLQQYKDSLRNLGMGTLQIEEMIRTRQFMENVNICSPADGIILSRRVSDGQRFEKGAELFQIAELSRIWILADIFGEEDQFIQPGAQVQFSIPNRVGSFSATLTKDLAQFDNTTRTLKLRFEAENPGYVLKPDMFVDIEMPTRMPEGLVVPAEAVLNSGLRKTVFVDRGNGCFESRAVQTGWRVGEYQQVLQGLEEGESIVTAGTFLLDSESRMKQAASSAPAIDPVCGMKVTPAKARAVGRVADHQGKTHFFCSDGCKEEFQASPEEFAR